MTLNQTIPGFFAENVLAGIKWSYKSLEGEKVIYFFPCESKGLRERVRKSFILPTLVTKVTDELCSGWFFSSDKS